MSRRLFTITQSGYVPNEVLTFWDRSSGGIRLTDLSYSSSGYVGTAIPNGVIAINPAGSALTVLGPEGIDTMYARKASDGTRALLTSGSGDSDTVQVRNTTASAWTTANPTLTAGELGYETDTRILKVGDGSTAYNSLRPVGPAVVMPAPSGDTTGATDSAAVQAAINASASGSEIVFQSGTYYFNATLILKGARRYRGANKTGTTLKQANSTNATAFIAAYEWYNNVTSSGDPIVFEYLTIDCNKANNTGTYGIVFLNYQSVIQHCYVNNAPTHGIVFSDKHSGGTVISNTAVENRVMHCFVSAPGGYGIWVIDTASSGKVTDGHCFANEVSAPGDTAIQIDRAAGWFISQNHVYGCTTNGIVVDAVWGTFVVDNEVDGFGTTNAATTYYGIRAVNIISGRQSRFAGNQVSTVEKALATYWYYALRVPAGVTMPVKIESNIAHKDSGSSAAAYGYTYQASATGTINVYQANNYSDVTTTIQTGGGGTINQYGPANGIASAEQDPLGSGVIATGVPAHMSGAAGNPGANTAVYGLLYGYGQSCSNLKIVVGGTSAGNISVGIYSATFTGSSRVPLTRRETSGAVACPATGIATVALGSTITINKNDYAGLSTDSGTATFGRSAPSVAQVTLGTAAFESSAHPLPSTSAAGNGSTFVPAIICA